MIEIFINNNNSATIRKSSTQIPNNRLNRYGSYFKLWPPKDISQGLDLRSNLQQQGKRKSQSCPHLNSCPVSGTKISNFAHSTSTVNGPLKGNPGKKGMKKNYKTDKFA